MKPWECNRCSNINEYDTVVCINCQDDKDVKIVEPKETHTDSNYIVLSLGTGSDESKVSLRLDKNAGGRIRWYDCTEESVTNNIKASLDGLAKLERIKSAVEIMERHIKETILESKK